MRRLLPLAAVACSLIATASSAWTARPKTVALSAVGDIAMAPSPDGGSGFFDPAIRRALGAEIEFGNLEGTLAIGGASKCGPTSTDCFAFRAPPSYARVLRSAGFTILNLANNHAFDYGAVGQAETLAALKAAGLATTGRPGQITYLRKGGTTVALLGFAPYPWAQSLLDIGGAVRLVRKADRKADVVVVTMHAGAEGSTSQRVRPGPETYLGEQRGNVVAFSHAVVNAGADLVLGHGPHVLRGMEWYRGRLIAYSLGNFLGNGTLSVAGVSGLSAILQVSLQRNGSWASGALVPVRMTTAGLPRIDPQHDALAVVRTLSRGDFGRDAVRVNASGVLLPPAWRTG